MSQRKPTFVNTIGSVSSGTMRDEDLIPAFVSELEYQMKRLRLTREQRKRFAKLIRECNDLDFDEIDLLDVSDYTSELFGALDEIAAPYMRFGALEGDGSDYGFWPCIDAAEEQCVCVNAGSIGIPRNAEVLIMNDHGNCTCGYVNARGKLTIYWECV